MLPPRLHKPATLGPGRAELQDIHTHMRPKQPTLPYLIRYISSPRSPYLMSAALSSYTRSGMRPATRSRSLSERPLSSGTCAAADTHPSHTHTHTCCSPLLGPTAGSVVVCTAHAATTTVCLNNWRRCKPSPLSCPATAETAALPTACPHLADEAQRVHPLCVLHDKPQEGHSIEGPQHHIRCGNHAGSTRRVEQQRHVSKHPAWPLCDAHGIALHACRLLSTCRSTVSQHTDTAVRYINTKRLRSNKSRPACIVPQKQSGI